MLARNSIRFELAEATDVTVERAVVVAEGENEGEDDEEQTEAGAGMLLCGVDEVRGVSTGVCMAGVI